MSLLNRILFKKLNFPLQAATVSDGGYHTVIGWLWSTHGRRAQKRKSRDIHATSAGSVPSLGLVLFLRISSPERPEIFQR